MEMVAGSMAEKSWYRVVMESGLSRAMDSLPMAFRRHARIWLDTCTTTCSHDMSAVTPRTTHSLPVFGSVTEAVQDVGQEGQDSRVVHHS